MIRRVAPKPSMRREPALLPAHTAERRGVTPEAIRQAFERRDAAAMVSMMAEDVVLHSPAAHLAFTGSDIVYTVLENLVSQSDPGSWLVTDIWIRKDTWLVEFRGPIRTRMIGYLSKMRLDEHGLLDEITIYGRPFAAIGAIPAFVYPRVVARHRSRARSVLVALLARPMLSLLEVGLDFVLWFSAPRGTTPGGDLLAPEATREGSGDA